YGADTFMDHYCSRRDILLLLSNDQFAWLLFIPGRRQLANCWLGDAFGVLLRDGHDFSRDMRLQEGLEIAKSAGDRDPRGRLLRGRNQRFSESELTMARGIVLHHVSLDTKTGLE